MSILFAQILILRDDFIIIATPRKFFTPVLADGFPWSLSENKSPQVSSMR